MYCKFFKISQCYNPVFFKVSIHLMKTKIFHALSSPLHSTETFTSSELKCVRHLSEPGYLRPALHNRLSIMPAVPIDRLGNQQLRPSDQRRRGEVGGGKRRWEVAPNPPHSTRQPRKRLHSAGVRLAGGWAHWWRLTPA